MTAPAPDTVGTAPLPRPAQRRPDGQDRSAQTGGERDGAARDVGEQDVGEQSAAELLVRHVAALLAAWGPLADGPAGGRRAAPTAGASTADAPTADAPTADAQAALRRLAGREGRAWTRLVELFGLTAAEADLLRLAVAVAVEPSLGSVVASSQGTPACPLPTEPLVKLLFGYGARPIWRPTGGLARWGLARRVEHRPGEPPGHEADPRIVDWLFGTLGLDDALVLAVDTHPLAATGGLPAAAPLPAEWPLRETVERLAPLLGEGTPVRLLVSGRPGSGRSSFAAAVAAALGRRALTVDAPALRGDWPEAFMRAQRFALLAGAALVWRDDTPPWPAKVPVAPLQAVCLAPGAQVAPYPAAADLPVTLPEPGVTSKAALWRALAPHLAADAGRLAATPGVSVADVAQTARAAPRTGDEAAAHLRSRARRRLGGVGRVVDPELGWADLVLAPGLEARLRAVGTEARHRPALLEDPETARLFAGTAGLSALFAGPPGVGKSMAAQVLARDLGVVLLAVDVAATTSKWVGETAKNLSAAFAQARAAGAALLFEEADALFARRTEVRDSSDRHANADTNHLLQLLEQHEGLVILTTNRRAAIDPAFVRRLRHVVEFPLPGPAERRQLWAQALRALGVETGPLGPALSGLAESHDLSPAQVKGAALSARYAALSAARSVTDADLVAGADRELAKEGRPAPVRPQQPPRSRRERA